MICQKLDVRNSHSMKYAEVTCYIQDSSPEMSVERRAMIVVCPGGAYYHTTDRDAEPVALQYVAMGYHAAVLRYSAAPARFPTAFLELAKTVVLLREHADQWNIDPDKILVSGFSAGGHLAASYGMFWGEEWVKSKLVVDSRLLQPNGMILGYPLISAGVYGHQDSFRNLLGDAYEDEEQLRKQSLEFWVNENTPPAFIWHTYEDMLVPVQNSLLLASEMARQKIPVEFHLFEKGGHGLSLGTWVTQCKDGYGLSDSVAEWAVLARNWLEARYR